ncbi:hypothetical protein SETIT_7G107000v2 [Setaria italica]|uniref:F-box domain-containing protein n=1 Tax=Setaria italica TaxID=4555 RepID=A0A368RUH5_SETIT|nr:hypothetical protein SETIT_7G107000v2 [Setaria italica]
MEAPGKRKRGNDAGDAAAGYSSGDDRDRLSALPDSLIHHIMSFMKARQVVQTCVLSTRWRHLWRSMTCLDVDKSEFETPGAKKYLDYEGWEKFEDFMDTLLSPGNVSIASLDTLRLQASYGIGEGRPASRWIRRGIKYPHGQLPAAGVHRGKVVSYNSWRLRRLHLSNIELCDLFAEHVRTSCQSLEDLELGSCSCKFHAIASGSLKNLALKYCTLYGLDEIATPTLKNLLIESGTGTNLKTMDRPLVITAPALASMFLGVTPHNFVGGLSLSEMTSLAKVLGEGSTTFIQFNNLRTLVLSHCDLSDDFQILGHFLRNSPNLERLTLLYCKYSNDTKKKKGPSKSKNAEYTPCPNLVDVPCKNLKLTHIIYKEDDIRQLIELLLHISGNLPNNYIKLTKARLWPSAIVI